MNRWVILELSPKAEGEDPSNIRASIRHFIRDAEVFFPASTTQVGDSRVTHYLVDGYAFIRADHTADKYFRLEGSKFVQSIVTQTVRYNGSRPVREPAFITDTDVEKFKAKAKVEEAQGIEVGDFVQIISGAYKNIKAVVLEDIPEMDSVQVQVQLRSKDSLVTLPRSFLKLIHKGYRPAYHDKVAILRDWMQMAIPIIKTDFNSSSIRTWHSKYAKASRWVRITGNFRTLVDIVKLEPFTTALLTSKYDSYQCVQDWCSDVLGLSAQLVFTKATDLVVPPSIRSKHETLTWIESSLDRARSLVSTIKELEFKSVPTNVIIDGHNMVCRCAMAPGLNTLTDKQGRPTGGILGFLNSLMSLRKKYPGCVFYVTWDGSSQRRKTVRPEYKANRGEAKAFFEVEWLKEFLPHLGIAQAYHKDEEADDVIASLLPKLYGPSQVIVSTDRDLLQLVSSTVSVLSPAAGGGKEKLFTPELVESEYGVTPERMTHLRALCGDTSDNLSGVSGFGLKTASKFLSIYGTVDKLYASSMVGLTKSQYEKVREARPLVMSNLEVMTLHKDVPYTLVSPVQNPDQIAVKSRLEALDINPSKILAAFLL